MARGVHIAGVVVVVSLGLGLVAWRLWGPGIAWPGTPPDEIARRWTEVEQIAGPTVDGPASPRLLAAIAAFKAHGEPPADDPKIDADSLGPDIRRALDELVAWDHEGGEVLDTCMSTEVVTLHRLGRVALRSAAAADDPVFTAALRLAAGLRRRGQLLAGVVGFGLADTALEVVNERGWDVRALAPWRPTEAELRGVLARESVCSLRTIDAAFADHCAGVEVPWYYPFGVRRWCARERAVFVDFYGRMHTRAAAVPLAELAATLAATEAELPDSVVSQAVAANMGSMAEKLTQQLARQDAALGR